MKELDKRSWERSSEKGRCPSAAIAVMLVLTTVGQKCAGSQVEAFHRNR